MALVDAPRRHRCAKVVVLSNHQVEASMGQASTIGLDIAKWVFQAHGADATGRVVFRKRRVRAKVLEFFAEQPPCLVALEACGGGALLGAGAWQAGSYGAAD